MSQAVAMIAVCLVLLVIFWGLESAKVTIQCANGMCIQLQRMGGVACHPPVQVKAMMAHGIDGSGLLARSAGMDGVAGPIWRPKTRP